MLGAVQFSSASVLAAPRFRKKEVSFGEKESKPSHAELLEQHAVLAREHEECTAMHARMLEIRREMAHRVDRAFADLSHLRIPHAGGAWTLIEEYRQLETRYAPRLEAYTTAATAYTEALESRKG